MDSATETSINEPPGIIHPDQALTSSSAAEVKVTTTQYNGKGHLDDDPKPQIDPTPEAKAAPLATEPIITPSTEPITTTAIETQTTLPTTEPSTTPTPDASIQEPKTAEALPQTTPVNAEMNQQQSQQEQFATQLTETTPQATFQPTTQEVNPQNSINEQVEAKMGIPNAPLTGSGGQPLGSASEAETISSGQNANIATTAPGEGITNNSATPNIEIQTTPTSETPEVTEPNLEALKMPLTEQLEADEKSPTPLTQTFMKFDEMLKGAGGNEELERIILEAAKEVAEKTATNSGIPAGSVKVDSTEN